MKEIESWTVWSCSILCKNKISFLSFGIWYWCLMISNEVGSSSPFSILPKYVSIKTLRFPRRNLRFLARVFNREIDKTSSVVVMKYGKRFDQKCFVKYSKFCRYNWVFYFFGKTSFHLNFMMIAIFTNIRNDEKGANYMMLVTLSSENKKSCNKKSMYWPGVFSWPKKV